MRCALCALTTATLLLASAAVARAGDLQLTIANGRVTLVADNVPLRTLLSEWARIGQTRIVNAEKLTGPPVTLRLHEVSEAQALDIVLRSASGYMAAPRPAGMPGASQYDRVVILASSRPTGGPPPANTNFQNTNPRFQTPPPMIQPVDNDEEDDKEIDDETAPTRVLPPGFQAQPGMPVQAPPPGMVLTPQQQQQLQMQMQQQQTQPPPGQVFAPVTSPRPGPVPIPQQPPQDPNKPIPR
jgi:hypothetical protein